MFAAIQGYAGSQPFNDWFTPDSTQRHALGTTIIAVDNFWGQGEFMYVKAADNIEKGELVGYDHTFAADTLSSSPNTGFPFGVAVAPIAEDDFGWIQISGRVVYKTATAVPGDSPVSIVAAGAVGAVVAGTQLLGIRNVVASTGNFSFTAETSANSATLFFPSGYDGIFLGMSITGAGIPASTVVAALDPDGKRVYTGSAIGVIGDKNSTATAQITLTGLYTGYGSGVISRPFVQGQIV